MPLFRYHCDDCGKVLICEKLTIPEMCNCVPSKKLKSNPYMMPCVPSPVTGKVVRSALPEVLGRDKNLASALTMVINGTASGRTSPNNPNVNHIHIGGVGAHNLFFDTTDQTILGVTLCGHIDKKNPAGVSAANNVAARVNDIKVSITVDPNGDITHP